MIRLYAAEGGELKPVDSGKLKEALWIDAVAPSPEEVDVLHKEFSIDLQDVADCLDPNEKSRVEIEETYDLLVLRSVLQEERNGKGRAAGIEIMPIGIFVTKKKIVTVRIGSTFAHQELTSDMKKKPRMETKEDLFLLLVRKVNRDIDRRVRPMERTIAAIQQRILGAKGFEVAPEAFGLSNSLILVNTALLSNLNAMSMLPKAKQLRLTKDQLDVSEDLENDASQMYEMTTIYREIMANILSAYESSIANSLSTVMKTLTTISLILILPMLIASLFSMNVGLPLGESDFAFWGVVGLSAIAVAALWLMFRIKGIL
ncbi:MAG TPA: magnesium transporter CorA family protein [Thermoplasmata archaeon]